MSDPFLGANGWRKFAVEKDERGLMDAIFNGFETKGWKDLSCPLPIWFKARDGLKVLDFGCGLGRTTYVLRENTVWDLTAYDLPEMIARAKAMHPLAGDIQWSSDWALLREQGFHLIHCSLVLQHIHPTPLAEYVADFARMTNCLVVRGRDWLDITKEHVHALIWPTLQAAGFTWQMTEKEGDHSTFVYMRKP